MLLYDLEKEVWEFLNGMVIQGNFWQNFLLIYGVFWATKPKQPLADNSTPRSRLDFQLKALLADFLWKAIKPGINIIRRLAAHNSS